jgi:serine protease AprX
VEGLAANDKQLDPTEVPYYTTGNGTSFSAPQVAGVIALMLEANPSLTPAQVRDILQRTATPLPPYYEYEVGAGMLNAPAAVLEAAFPQRRFGQWRGTAYQGQVQFINNAPQVFTGAVGPGSANDSAISIAPGVLRASVQIAWGGLLSANTLALTLLDSQGAYRECGKLSRTNRAPPAQRRRLAGGRHLEGTSTTDVRSPGSAALNWRECGFDELQRFASLYRNHSDD